MWDLLRKLEMSNLQNHVSLTVICLSSVYRAKPSKLELFNWWRAQGIRRLMIGYNSPLNINCARLHYDMAQWIKNTSYQIAKQAFVFQKKCNLLILQLRLKIFIFCCEIKYMLWLPSLCARTLPAMFLRCNFKIAIQFKCSMLHQLFWNLFYKL